MGVIGKVGNFYCGTRMCACEGGSPTNNWCPYRCLSAPTHHPLNPSSFFSTKSIIVLITGKHRHNVSNYKGLNRKSLVQIQKLWIPYSEFLISKYEYVTSQICYKLLRFEGQDEKDFTRYSNITF